MTDLEITKLCAEAMGLQFRVKQNGVGNEDVSLDGVDLYDPGCNMWNRCYLPLSDDAQAMALAKRFGLLLDPQQDGQDFAIDPGWEVSHVSFPDALFINSDLNRAICECVAKMQAAK